MPPKITNRFALFGNKDEEEHSHAQHEPKKANPFVNQVADSDTSWQKVKRPGSVQKPMTTLVIRNTSRKPSLVSPGTQARKSSGTQQISLGLENNERFNYRENWCGVCSQYFHSKTLLQSHIKTFAATHSNYCNLCKRVFVDRNGKYCPQATANAKK
jgi:hypothetical protein